MEVSTQILQVEVPPAAPPVPLPVKPPEANLVKDKSALLAIKVLPATKRRTQNPQRKVPITISHSKKLQEMPMLTPRFGSTGQRRIKTIITLIKRRPCLVTAASCRMF